MAEFVGKAKEQLSVLDGQFSGSKLLSQFEKQTKLPRSYAIVGGVALYLLIIFINVGGLGEILSNLIGFVLPSYFSLKALKTSSTTDDTQLLTYWIVFAFFSVIEFWSKAILYWVPFYWFFKTIFLLFIALPQFGGASLIYSRVIAPLTDPYILPTLGSKSAGISSKLEKAGKDASSGRSTGVSPN